MNKQQEALRLALEALEKMGRVMKQSPDTEKAITAIREALADSALDRMAENARELGLDYEPACKTGSQCTSKCQQCEQPEQQSYCNDCGGFDPECPLVQPAQQQEPVAWYDEEYDCAYTAAELDGGTVDGLVPLYTSPPASKPWVGLTDEEYSQLHDGFHQQGKLLGWVVDQVETKLREKNA